MLWLIMLSLDARPFRIEEDGLHADQEGVGITLDARSLDLANSAI
jgi:hypothetical protein